jgi:hypothetical protein
VWIENLTPGEFLKLLDDEMKSRKMRRYTSERFPLVKYGAATLLVPDQSGTFPHELVACSKNDPIFVVNRDNMGHKNDDDNSQIVQNVLGQLGDSGLQDADHCFTTAAFFQQTLYFIGNNDVIKAFSLDTAGGKLSLTPTSKGSFVYDFPGGQPVVSSNGSTNGKVYVGTKTALVVFGLN